MKQFTFLLLFFLIIFSATAQRTLISEDVASYDLTPPRNGPNCRHYSHIYFDFAFYTPNPFEEQIQIKYGLSYSYTTGYRYKLKLAEWFAIGGDLKHNTMNVNFKNTFKPFSEKIDIEHKSDRMRLSSIGTELYLRLNFGKRGNTIGKFIDIAGYANLIYLSKHVYTKNYTPPNIYQATKEKVINYNLAYITPYFYGAKLRLGINRYVISFDYRISEIFSQTFMTETGNSELPKFTIGLQIGLF